MANFVSDTFAGADGVGLASHTGEVGATWTKAAGFAADAQLLAGRVRGVTAGQNAAYYASGVPSSADYAVAAKVRVVTAAADVAGGVIGRCSTSAGTFYLLFLYNNTIAVYKCVAGSLTQLGSDAAYATADGSDHWVRLVMAGTSLKAQTSPDGVTYTDRVSVTDATITIPGRAGVWLTGGSATTGAHVDSVVTTDDSTAGPGGSAVTDATSPDGTAVCVLTPPGYDPALGADLVLYHHGAGETRTALTDDPLKAGVVAALVGAGYVVAGSTAAGENWGNQAGMDAMLSLYAWCVEHRRVKRVLFLSQSMGGLTGLLCLADQRFPVAGWYGIYPVCSLSSMFGANAGTYAPAIRAAYGVASDGSDYAARTAGHDPIVLPAAAFPRVGVRFVASYADTVVGRAANADAMAAALAARCPEAAVVAHTGGHGDPSAFSPSDVVAFFGRCVARATAAPVSRPRPAAVGRRSF